MTMSLDDMYKVVKQCQYPGWRFRFNWDEGREPRKVYAYVQVRCWEGKCNVSGDALEWSGRKWRLSSNMTPSEIVQTCFMAVLAAEEHEVREKFKYKGVTVMQPHRDLDVVVQQAQTLSERPASENNEPAPKSTASEVHKRATDAGARDTPISYSTEGTVFMMAGYKFSIERARNLGLIL